MRSGDGLKYSIFVLFSCQLILSVFFFKSTVIISRIPPLNAAVGMFLKINALK